MSSPPEVRSRKPNACPICRKPAAEPFRPFCSRRCADVDLHRWLAGVYAAPAFEAEGDDDTDASTSPAR